MVNKAHSLLLKAAGLFREYEAHHRAKASEAGRPEKAERNAAIAEEIEACVVDLAIADALQSGYTDTMRQRAIEKLEAGPLGFTDWGKIVDDVAEALGMVRVAEGYRSSATAKTRGAVERAREVEKALKWIDHNLRLAQQLMRTSVKSGNGRDNFSAHAAHQALTLAASALRASGQGRDREAIRAEIINTPETADFMAGVPIEAAHQRERWGAEHDAGKQPLDWFWLIGYLSQKAAMSAMAGDTNKALHHTISTAAALANWHAALSGKSTAMRPGIDPSALQSGEARA